MTDELITWLRAQLVEDEQWARGVLVPPAHWRGATMTDAVIAGLARRQLAEVDAKRRILDRCDYELRAYVGSASQVALAYLVLKQFALPYADRPGYRDEWRP